jgi:hypothetical protein
MLVPESLPLEPESIRDAPLSSRAASGGAELSSPHASVVAVATAAPKANVAARPSRRPGATPDGASDVGSASAQKGQRGSSSRT